MLNRLSYENLKNWFYLIFKIEQVWIIIKNLSLFQISLWIWYEYSLGRLINIEVIFFIIILDELVHVACITEFLPHVLLLHLLHLDSMLILSHLLLPHLLLLPSSSKLLLPLFHVGFFHLLLFNQCGIWLHIYRNDKSCESVTSYNSSIIHYVLRSNLTIKK